jgi:peroxiredoxin
VNHLPPFIQKYEEFKAKGVDVIAVLAANDPFVMSAWVRTIGSKDQACIPILSMSVFLNCSFFFFLFPDSDHFPF